MARFKPGTRLKYRDGVIYQVQKDGSYRREDGGKVGKAERKAAKRDKHKVHRLKTCATGVKT
jgi:hypothetical protein